jgi:hypothetical protein
MFRILENIIFSTWSFRFTIDGHLDGGEEKAMVALRIKSGADFDS